jgi:SSS family solute:Na+ symporter
MAPPWGAVFLSGVLWPGATPRAALAALVTGLVLGLGRLVLELNRAEVSGWAERLATINFLHFAILLFAICSAVLVLVSVCTRAPDAERVAPLTVRYYRTAVHERLPRAADIALSIGIVALVVGAWFYFS